MLAAATLSAQSTTVVDTDLGNRMTELFPQLEEGYIDLNANGSLDRFQDMDEKVPESLIQDGTLQVQEILDFIIDNYRFFTASRLEEVRGALEEAEGDIPEIIAISYQDRLSGVIEEKREFGPDEIYLPPSVLARAQEEMEGYIATMLHSFRKEAPEFADRFAQAREQLFSMMEAGYPLPSLSDADESLLSSSMIHTIMTTGTDNPERVKAAIRTLGRMQSEQAIPQLEELLASEEFRVSAAEALGAIGNNTARNILMDTLAQSSPGAFQNALIRAVGSVGGEESADRIIALAEETREAQAAGTTGSGGEAAGRKMLTILEAMADLTAQGNRDRKLYEILSDYVEHPDPAYRRVAVEGVASYGGRNALGELQPRLSEEQNEDVLVTLVNRLAEYEETSVLSSFTNLLGAPGTSQRVEEEILSAIGSHENGTRVVTSLIDYLDHESESLRRTAAGSLRSLYENDARAVTGALGRAVGNSESELLLEEATAILADLADPAALTSLLNLLGSEYPEVRKNATWGLYRIRPTDNVRVAQELQKLVTSEAEPLEVRINAVRALGAMGQDSARLEVEKTLTTTLKLSSPEYVMLRYFAVRALAELPSLSADTRESLLETAGSTEPEIIRTAALDTLLDDGAQVTDRRSEVVGLAQRSEDPRVKLAALRLLSDMGAGEAVGVARSLLDAADSEPIVMHAAYALSKVGTEDAISLLVDLAADSSSSEIAMGLLRDADPNIVARVVERRLQTVEDEATRAVLEQLQSVAGR